MNKPHWWSDSNIRSSFAEPRLRMLESKDHQRPIDASGALDLTFAKEIAAHE
jgi:hypothetical protein